MRGHPAPAVLPTVQILLVLISSIESHIIYPPLQRYPNLGYGIPEGPVGPYPLIVPHHQRHPFHTDDIPHFSHISELPELTHHVPLVYPARAPPPQVLVVPLRGVFPPFIERIVQRIQTFWSVYNPPEGLTRPPVDEPTTTTKRPKKKATTTTTTTAIPEDEVDLEDETTLSPETAEDSVTSPTELTTTKVSTLAVYEVTPTMAPVMQDTEPEEPMFITPERASVLGQKDVILRFLQTGQVPPHLQPDSVNEMDNMFENS